MTVPPELRQREWVAIRTANDGGMARRLGTRAAECTLHEALAGAGSRPVVAIRDGRVFVFGADLDPVALSEEYGEVCGFRIDTAGRHVRCVRCLSGEVVRRLERSGDGDTISEGRPGQKREPPIDRMDGNTVLAFAAAWYCDPRPALSDRAWIIEPRRSRRTAPHAARPPVPRSQWVWMGAAFLAVFSLVLVIEPPEPVSADRPGGVRGGAGLAACVSETTCEACRRCATTNVDHPCAERVARCAADPACMQVWTCLDACGAAQRESLRQLDEAPHGTGVGFDLACDDRCRQAQPEGAEQFLDWHRCVHDESCARQCASL